ncbi:MAG TPA: BrnA antitoxin family protein [Azospirillum sp.]|nr:BrnA antitoxin family protein [Azospirillum sp.]
MRRSSGSPRTKKTDWSRADALSDDQIRAAVESDPDAAPIVDEAWFEQAEVVEPATKTAISIRIDREVLDYFKASSRRYQTKINAVLRAYMEHERSKR